VIFFLFASAGMGNERQGAKTAKPIGQKPRLTPALCLSIFISGQVAGFSPA